MGKDASVVVAYWSIWYFRRLIYGKNEAAVIIKEVMSPPKTFSIAAFRRNSCEALRKEILWTVFSNCLLQYFQTNNLQYIYIFGDISNDLFSKPSILIYNSIRS